MPAKVTIEVVKGSLCGMVYTFDEPQCCILGRATDCDPQLPDDADHKKISRHHCMVDINPPDVRVRDLGSFNGTYVNGKKIGQRHGGQRALQNLDIQYPEYDLEDGDHLELGGTVFRIGVYVPAVCEECSSDIPDEFRSSTERIPGTCVCESCWERLQQEGRTFVSKRRLCAICGKDVGSETTRNRHGDYVCAACRATPMGIIRNLVSRAATGRKGLEVIRGFRLVEEIGKGSQGAVYLAEKESTGEDGGGSRRLRGERVALKVMFPAVAADDSARERFMREIDCMKSLCHPNVVRLFDCGSADGMFFFTMEYCNGGSVSRLMNRSGDRLPLDDALSLVFQALDGLEHAHQQEIRVTLADGSVQCVQGTVHRDIKPANLFLDTEGKSMVAKIGDFGLSKAFAAAGLSGLTRTGECAGTVGFMPRQQVVNFIYSGPDVDVWAMAASLYNMVTGCYPRHFPSGRDPWQVVLQTDPIPVRRHNPDIPGRLAEVLDAALADRDGLCFQSASALKSALQGAL